mmetsp:Transcript_7668/g.23178  ORF Transcript_7668/g.23178 Transcript_7668/m.23178 type:complete len:261 (+) Transcript_7668:283-1065(+)
MKMRNLFILLRSCPRSGEQSLQSSVELPLSAWSDTRSFWTRLCAMTGKHRTRRTTPASSSPARSTPTPSASPRARIRWTWTRTRRRCFPRRARGWPTPRARRPSARRVRSSWLRPSDWPAFRNGASSRPRASTWGAAARSRASITTPRSPSSTRRRAASTRWTARTPSCARRNSPTSRSRRWRGAGETRSRPRKPRRMLASSRSARRRTCRRRSRPPTRSTTPPSKSAGRAWCCLPRRCRTASWRRSPSWAPPRTWTSTA